MNPHLGGCKTDCYSLESLLMLKTELKTKSLTMWLFATLLISTAALLPVGSTWAQSARGLPDFTELVEQVGPSVVNIRTLEKAAVRSGAESGVDEDMLEFFRRFGIPIPNAPRQGPRSEGGGTQEGHRQGAGHQDHRRQGG